MTIEIANRLIELRRRAGLSQEELAEKLGISRQAVSKWERAESGPDVDNAIMLARLYNLSLDELFGNKPEYERELDMMEPDNPCGEPEDAEDAEEPEAARGDGADGEGSYTFGLDERIGESVRGERPWPREAGSVLPHLAGMQPAAYAPAAQVPENALRGAGVNTFDGIKNVSCCIRADLTLTGSGSEACTVSVEGPEKEAERCRVWQEGATLHIAGEDERRSFFRFFGGRTLLRITVAVPAGCENAEVALKGGDLTADGLRTGRLLGRTGGGDITVGSSVFDSLELKTGGGDVEIAGSAAQRTELATGGGDIKTADLDSGSLLCVKTGGGDMSVGGAARCVEATTGGGDIELDVTAEGVNAKTGGGDIALICTGAKYVSAKTGGGDVKAKLVGCTGVTADIASMGGEAAVDFKNENHSAGRKLNFTAGDGSTVIEMRSGGGDITVTAE